MTFDPKMLRTFEKIFRETKSSAGWKGASIESWRGTTGYQPPASISQDLLQKRLERSDLRTLRNNTAFDTYDLCVFILAWGEMHRNNASLFLKRRDDWMPVAEDLRAGRIDPDTGYERFFKLSRAKKMPGCGPAYYTKLLFFLPPEGARRGVIMDQWTSRSINVLTQRPVVKLLPTDVGYRVAPTNSEKVYAEFCGLVEDLSQEICKDRSPDKVEEIEMQLFSKGGARKDPWRKLVASRDQRGKLRHLPDEELASGYVIIFEPDASSPLSDERHPSSRIYADLEEAEAAVDRNDRRGKVLDIVPIYWSDGDAGKIW